MARQFAFMVMVLLCLGAGHVLPAIADQYGEGLDAYNKGDFRTAIWKLEPLAEQGNPDAQTRLGDMYYGGDGVEKNIEEAIKWYRRAAEQGNRQAEVMLLMIYTYSSSPPNYSEIAKLYRKEAAEGDSDAALALARMYQKGEGLKQDYAEAKKWYRKAADLGNEIAKLKLAQLASDGDNGQGEQKTAISSARREHRIQMVKEGGTYTVPVVINDVLSLKFIIDSGAADVAVPADVAMVLFRTGTVKDSDFIGSQKYRLADGSEVESKQFIIRSLKVGDQVIQDVQASISDVKGSLLLGQSFLEKFKSWSMDNSTHELVLK